MDQEKDKQKQIKVKYTELTGMELVESNDGNFSELSKLRKQLADLKQERSQNKLKSEQLIESERDARKKAEKEL